MSKHTPGPWAFAGDGTFESIKDIGICRQDQAGISLCFVSTSDPAVHAEYTANARLIAAAPELLAACQAILEWGDRESDHAIGFSERISMCEKAFLKARAAISRATGATT